MEIHIIEVGHSPLTTDTQTCPTNTEKEYNTRERPMCSKTPKKALVQQTPKRPV